MMVGKRALIASTATEPQMVVLYNLVLGYKTVWGQMGHVPTSDWSSQDKRINAVSMMTEPRADN